MRMRIHGEIICKPFSLSIDQKNALKEILSECEPEKIIEFISDIEDAKSLSNGICNNINGNTKSDLLDKIGKLQKNSQELLLQLTGDEFYNAHAYIDFSSRDVMVRSLSDFLNVLKKGQSEVMRINLKKTKDFSRIYIAMRISLALQNILDIKPSIYTGSIYDKCYRIVIFHGRAIEDVRRDLRYGVILAKKNIFDKGVTVIPFYEIK